MAWPTGWTVLPPLVAGHDAEAYAISADGSTVVGYANDAGDQEHAVLWTVDGIIDLGWLTVDAGYSEAHAVNADGSVVVGEARVSLVDPESHAFRWTAGGGMADLGVGSVLGRDGSTAFDVSDDGSVVVGEAFGGLSINAGFHWTAGGGLIEITDSVHSMSAATVSPDGSQILIQSDTVHTWTSGGGLVDTGLVAPPTTPPSTSSAQALYGIIANDGTVFIVGSISPAGVFTGYLYEIVPAATLTLLAQPVGADAWFSGAATLDGAIVAGYWADVDSVNHLAIWQGAITSVDAPATYDTPTVSVFAGRNITADGQRFVGSIYDSDGNLHGFVYGLETATPVVTAPDYAIELDEDTRYSSALVATVVPDLPLTYTALAAPTHGVLTLNTDGTYTYRAARAYFGADGFTYRATEPISGQFDDGSVTITIHQAFPLSGVVKVLLPPAELQFCDANGLPFAGGTLEFYEPGTTNPKDTWSSPTGDSGTLNTNPLVLDAAGRALIYGDGAYRTVLRDAAGNLIWDQPSFTYVSAAMVPVVGAADLATAREAMGITDAIEAEAEARAAADSAEQTAREAADAAEAAARAAEDTTLANLIAAETARAEAAEAALAAMPITSLKGGMATTGPSGTATVTFSPAFPTSCTSVVCTPVGNPINLVPRLEAPPTAGGFTVFIEDTDNSRGFTTQFCWLATGT